MNFKKIPSRLGPYASFCLTGLGFFALHFTNSCLIRKEKDRDPTMQRLPLHHCKNISKNPEDDVPSIFKKN